MSNKKFNKFGKNHWNWKGGIKINSQGYILVYCPKHPYRDKQNYVRKHRIVMEKSIGRYVLPIEIVHHINGIKNDNRLKNLSLMLKKQHDKISAQTRKKKLKIIKICPICKKTFEVFLSLSRVNCCSRSCQAKKRWFSGKSEFGR